MCGAGAGNRTPVTSLENWDNSRYTTPAQTDRLYGITGRCAKLTQEGVDPAIHAYRFLRAQAYQAIEKGSIAIWNQPFTNLDIFRTMTQRMYDHAAANDVKLSILVIEVETDPVVAQERVAARKAAGGHGPSDNTFNRFVSSYASFASEGFDIITVTDGDDRIESIAKIKDTILRLKAS